MLGRQGLLGVLRGLFERGHDPRWVVDMTPYQVWKLVFREEKPSPGERDRVDLTRHFNEERAKEGVQPGIPDFILSHVRRVRR